MALRPMKACDLDVAVLEAHFASGKKAIQMPKIDGVRLLHMPDQVQAMSREMKPYRNAHTTNKFSTPAHNQFDGELTVRGLEKDPSCCRKTQSAVTTAAGTPDIVWNLFDLVLPDLPYEQRLAQLHSMELPQDCVLVPYEIVSSMDEVYANDIKWCQMGYEGSIVRNPAAEYKHGRCTPKDFNYVRLKAFVDEEARVVSLNEAMTNENEATVDALGYTTRTSHQENTFGAGRIGSFNCWSEKWGEFIVAAGCLTHEQAEEWWIHPDQIVGEQITFKYFPKGIKDKPRFPTFKVLRSQEDLPE